MKSSLLFLYNSKVSWRVSAANIKLLESLVFGLWSLLLALLRLEHGFR